MRLMPQGEKFVMDGQAGIYQRDADIYDLVYAFKDYAAEANRVRGLLLRHAHSSGNRLLDVACGTGKHLEHLQQHFNCMGVDLSPEILSIARERIPGIPLVQGSMLDLDLDQQFDMITCLFSAIGYTLTLEGLQQTMRTFARHLVLGGAVVIEPWVLEPNYREGKVHSKVYHDTPELQIARTSYSERRGKTSVTYFHMVVAEAGKGIRHFDEVHKLGLFTVDEYLESMSLAGLEANFMSHGFTQDRGLLVGTRIK